jgi:hypothetical protein
MRYYINTSSNVEYIYLDGAAVNSTHIHTLSISSSDEFANILHFLHMDSITPSASIGYYMYHLPQDKTTRFAQVGAYAQ